MKSKLKKRMLALTLCMVMVLSGSTSALAGDANVENANNVETVQEIPSEPVAIAEEPPVEDIPEPITEPPVAETPAEPPVEAETPAEPPVEAETPPAEETAPETPEEPIVEEPETEEPVAEEPTEEPADEEKKELHQDAMELVQKMTDVDGKVICTVKANIPEGTFNANTSDVSMEVNEVDADTVNTITVLMENTLTEDKGLGEFFLYKVDFKVNGETVEPEREIKLTFTKKNFKVDDVKKANVFYYNEANSVEENIVEEIIIIPQKAEKIEELQNTGQSIEDIDDYDLTAISLNEDGTANTIQTEGRRSTIYGCYIEEEKPEEIVEEPEELTELTFEGSDFTIVATYNKDAGFSENVTLDVREVEKGTEEYEQCYQQSLNTIVENTYITSADYVNISFARYFDITFLDDGKEVEPNTPIDVKISYNDAIEVFEEETVNAIHFPENGETELIETETIENSDGVETVEFVQNSFSVSGTLVSLLEDSDPDRPYISVQKTFVGLTDPATQVSGFEINLYSDSACINSVASLTLSTGQKSSDGMVYNWKIDNLEAGTYYLKENNETVEGYTVVTTVNGEVVDTSQPVTVVTQKPEYIFDENTTEYPECGWTEKPFSGNFIAGSLTEGGKGLFFVWTENTLSSGERAAIVDWINKNGQGGNWKKMEVSNTVFFSTLESLQGGINYKGSIQVKDGKLYFQAQNQWQRVILGGYTKTEKVNADIEVVNTYTEDKITIDLRKYGSSYEGSQLTGATFSLYEGTPNSDMNSINWAMTPITGYDNFDVTETNLSELNLSKGYYKLVENTAPEGYQKLDKPIYFKVEAGTVVLTDLNGTPLSSSIQDMWKLEGTKPTFVISIKNTALYELPSTGGNGIYWYMIGGMLLMLAAALILYKNKCKEVLGS